MTRRLLLAVVPLAVVVYFLVRPGLWPRKPTSQGSPWFVDATAAMRLDFVHDAGPLGDYFMPQALGSGLAVFDADGDGRPDLYFVHNGGPKGKKNQLFRQTAEGTFEDVSAGSGLDVAGFGMGVAVGDVNNDGRPDVVVTEYAGVRLFLNEGGRFREVTSEAGLDNRAWATAAAFVDYDRDGWLDLVVVNYVALDPTWPCSPGGRARDYCPPRTFAGQVTRLYRNRDGRHFDDVTIKSGLGTKAGPGLGVLIADFDGDGWPDVFVANDGAANHLWVNQKNGTFTEEAVARNVAYNAMGQSEAGMGVALDDVDGDGLADLVISHLTEENHTLWMQGPRGQFRDRTAVRGLTGTRWRGTGFGLVLADFDHDGALDLAVVHGRIARGPTVTNAALGPHWGRYAERNLLLAGGERFRDISADNPDLCGTPNVARGLAVADLDGDGALDLVVTTAGGPARILRNARAERGHWLMVRAVDPRYRRDALGAEVVVHVDGKILPRRIAPASSYLCSSDVRAHFGLGACDHIDGIEVKWPDGIVEMFFHGAIDRVVELRRGEGGK